MTERNSTPAQTTESWEDDYPELHIEDATYSDFDWDTLAPEMVNRHDTILEMDAAGLSALNEDDDFYRWAAARAWLSNEDAAAFIALTRKILETPQEKRSPQLSYSDIMLTLARALAAEGDHLEGMKLLDEYDGLDDADAIEGARHRGLLLLENKEEEAGVAALVNIIKSHAESEPDLGLHLSEDLVGLDHHKAAKRVLLATREVAQARALPELLHEINDALTALS